MRSRWESKTPKHQISQNFSGILCFPRRNADGMSFSGNRKFCSIKALPEAIGLNVEALDDFVELTWETSVETDIKGYEVEKSSKGKSVLAFTHPI